MRVIKRLLLTILLILPVVTQLPAATNAAVTITGTIRQPNGALFNGSAVFYLPFAGVKNGADPACPACPMVFQGPVRFPIVNGRIVGQGAAPPQLIANGDIVPQNTYYQVRMFDAASVYQQTFYVYIPPVSASSTFDIGTASQTNITTQNISFVTLNTDCKNFGSVRCISPSNTQKWAGTELGGWFASAKADLLASNPNGGTIQLMAGVYNNVTSQMVTTDGPNYTVTGTGQGATIINWTGPAVATFLVGGVGGGTQIFENFTIAGAGASAPGQRGIYVNGANQPVTIRNVEIRDPGDDAAYVDGGTAHVDFNNVYIHHVLNGCGLHVNSATAENVVLDNHELYNVDCGVWVQASASGIGVRDGDIEGGNDGTPSTRQMLRIDPGNPGVVTANNTWGLGPTSTANEVALANTLNGYISTGDKFSIGVNTQISFHAGSAMQALLMLQPSFSSVALGGGTGVQLDGGATDNWFMLPRFFNNFTTNAVDNGTRTNFVSDITSVAKINMLGPITTTGPVTAPQYNSVGTGGGAYGLSQGTPQNPDANSIQFIAPVTIASAFNEVQPGAAGAGIFRSTLGTGATGHVVCAGCGTIPNTPVIDTPGTYLQIPGCEVRGGGGTGGKCVVTALGGTGTQIVAANVQITVAGSGYTTNPTLFFYDQSEKAYNNASDDCSVTFLGAVHCVTLDMLTANYSNSTTTFSNVLPSSFNIAVNQVVKVECTFSFTSSATTAAPILQLTGPASPTRVVFAGHEVKTDGGTPTTYEHVASGTTFAIAMGDTAVVSTATPMEFSLRGTVQNGATSGVLQVQAKANGAGTVIIQNGSYCTFQ